MNLAFIEQYEELIVIFSTIGFGVSVILIIVIIDKIFDKICEFFELFETIKDIKEKLEYQELKNIQNRNLIKQLERKVYGRNK